MAERAAGLGSTLTGLGRTSVRFVGTVRRIRRTVMVGRAAARGGLTTSGSEIAGLELFTIGVTDAIAFHERALMGAYITVIAVGAIRIETTVPGLSFATPRE